MRFLLSALLVLLMLWAFRSFDPGSHGRRNNDPPSPRVELSWIERKHALEARYGIEIEFDDLEFPVDWMHLNPQWAPVPLSDRYQSLEHLETDLARYDPAFLGLHLTRLFVFRSLSFDGHSFGGTNDHRARWLYLHDAWLGDAGHDYAMGFHHELSSILLKRHPAWFPEQQWRAANGAGFHYAFSTSTKENIASGRTNMRTDRESSRAGFVSEYGQLSLEDDFNTYAQYWIAKPSKLGEIGRRHPQVAQKMELVAGFYRHVGFVPRDGP